MSFPVVISIFAGAIFLVAGLIYMVLRSPRTTTSSDVFTSGTMCKGYVLQGFLKRGGMATIYRAADATTGAPVALKVMHTTLMDDRDLVDKFLNEGELLALINQRHPDAPVVKVLNHGYGDGELDGRPFIALELITGKDLDDYIREGKRFTAAETLQIIHAAAAGLVAAHAECTWHRDISPGNVIVSTRGGQISGVTLIDFGVAKHEYLSSKTPDGSIHGAPPFMSPEQCRSEEIDGRSDIYSLGILAFTLLAGQPPFMSRNPLEIMRMHEQMPLPPLPAGVPSDLGDLMADMLEKSREDRIQTMTEILDRLTVMLEERGVSPLITGGESEGPEAFAWTAPTWVRTGIPRFVVSLREFFHRKDEGADDSKGEEWSPSLSERLAAWVGRQPKWRIITVASVLVLTLVTSAIVALQRSGDEFSSDHAATLVYDPEQGPFAWVDTVDGDFFAAITIDATMCGDSVGVAIGELGSEKYHRLILNTGQWTYERMAGRRSSILSQGIGERGAADTRHDIMVHWINGYLYVTVDGKSEFTVEQVSRYGGGKHIGICASTACQIPYTSKIFPVMYH